MTEECNLNHSCGDACSANLMGPITDFEKGNLILKDRLISIQNQCYQVKKLLHDTKSQIEEKRELLKKNEEMKKNSLCNCDSEIQLSNGVQMLQICDTEPTLNDMTMLDYEKSLSIYRDTCAKAHAEKRMHLRRHLAANDFKKRLLEVENMCNIELLRIKKNVQLLQPLQVIASQWSLDNDNSRTCLDEEFTGCNKYGTSDIKEIMAQSTLSRSSSENSS